MNFFTGLNLRQRYNLVVFIAIAFICLPISTAIPNIFAGLAILSFYAAGNIKNKLSIFPLVILTLHVSEILIRIHCRKH